MHGNTSERDIGCLMIAANADVASVTRSELWFSQHTKYWARCCMRMFQMRSECESSSAANYLLWPLTKDEHTLCNIVAKPNMHFARVSWLVSVGWLSFFSLLLLIQFLWYYIANEHCVFNDSDFCCCCSSSLVHFMCAALLSLIHCNSSSSRFLVPFLFVPRTNHSLGSAVCVFSGCNSIAFCIHRRIAFIGIGRYRTNFVNSMQVCSTDSFFSLFLSLCVDFGMDCVNVVLCFMSLQLAMMMLSVFYVHIDCFITVLGLYLWTQCIQSIFLRRPW